MQLIRIYDMPPCRMVASKVGMLGEPALAKRLGITARQIASTVHSHPTMYEGLLEATEEVL